MAYHLSTGKAADLVGKFLETSPGVTRGELRALQRLSNIRQSAGWGCIEEYKFKVVSLFNKAFEVEPNTGLEVDNELLSICRTGLHSIQVQTQIIKQEPATLEKGFRIVISEISILS